jgi:hypothetical protein
MSGLPHSAPGHVQRAAVALVAALSIAGCGPGAASPAPTGTASQPGAATQSPTGGSGVACTLLPIEDVEAALGASGITSKGSVTGAGEFETTICDYAAADGTLLARVSHMAQNGAQIYDTNSATEDAVPIPGIADGAVIISGELYIKKADTLFIFDPEVENLSEAVFQVLATAAAARLP